MKEIIRVLWVLIFIGFTGPVLAQDSYRASIATSLVYLNGEVGEAYSYMASGTAYFTPVEITGRRPYALEPFLGRSAGVNTSIQKTIIKYDDIYFVESVDTIDQSYDVFLASPKLPWRVSFSQVSTDYDYIFQDGVKLKSKDHKVRTGQLTYYLSQNVTFSVFRKQFKEPSSSEVDGKAVSLFGYAPITYDSGFSVELSYDVYKYKTQNLSLGGAGDFYSDKERRINVTFALYPVQTDLLSFSIEGNDHSTKYLEYRAYTVSYEHYFSASLSLDVSASLFEWGQLPHLDSTDVGLGVVYRF